MWHLRLVQKHLFIMPGTEPPRMHHTSFSEKDTSLKLHFPFKPLRQKSNDYKIDLFLTLWPTKWHMKLKWQNLPPNSIRGDSTYGAHPTSDIFFFCFWKVNQGAYSYMWIFIVISLSSMLINEEKQSQQTENKEFLVCDFLFGWFSGLFLGVFFPFLCVCGIARFLFFFFYSPKYNTSRSQFWRICKGNVYSLPAIQAGSRYSWVLRDARNYAWMIIYLEWRATVKHLSLFVPGQKFQPAI